MESWLDENPDFFQTYLTRKATRPMIDAWLVAHAIPPGGTGLTQVMRMMIMLMMIALIMIGIWRR